VPLVAVRTPRGRPDPGTDGRKAVAALLVPRETAPGERRVAATPETVGKLTGAGLEVAVERGAGAAARIGDDEFAAAGARLVEPGAAVTAAIVVRVAPPDLDEVAALAEGTVLLSFVAPHRNLPVVRALAERGVTTLAMELVPRISRAQAIDALSSQANLVGYRAVIVASYHLDKYFPLFMTAAGTIRPATVVVLGAGVAGLQAVATARRLGAVVKVSDVRAAAKEEVASLGATFLDVPEAQDLTGEGGYAKEVGEDFLTRQRAVLTEAIASAHAVITTAQIPGRPAPVLLTADMVAAMPAGAVVVDVAAADGGNCELTSIDGPVEHHGVTILPGHELASEMPREASALYARNVAAFCALLVADGEVRLDLDDQVVAGALLTHAGAVVHDRTAQLLEGGTA
jgi:H+-translocating NAD(P) transhydrogenase subunit alpha